TARGWYDQEQSPETHCPRHRLALSHRAEEGVEGIEGRCSRSRNCHCLARCNYVDIVLQTLRFSRQHTTPQFFFLTPIPNTRRTPSHNSTMPSRGIGGLTWLPVCSSPPLSGQRLPDMHREVRDASKPLSCDTG